MEYSRETLDAMREYAKAWSAISDANVVRWIDNWYPGGVEAFISERVSS